jgi:hypothetical protein
MSTTKKSKPKNTEVVTKQDQSVLTKKSSVKPKNTEASKLKSVSEGIVESTTDADKHLKHETKEANHEIELEDIKKDSAKVENTPHHHRKSKNLVKRIFLSVVAVLILLMIVTAGAWQWTLSTPEYGYYKMYQAVKNKDYDGFIKYTDTMKLADSVTKDQEVFFQGQQADTNAVKFELKGKIEYTFNKMIEDGTLVDILPFKANNLQDIFKNKDIKKVSKTSFEIEFTNSDKIGNGEGIGGYKKAVFEYKNSKWTFVDLENNPTLEGQKAQFTQGKTM